MATEDDDAAKEEAKDVVEVPPTLDASPARSDGSPAAPPTLRRKSGVKKLNSQHLAICTSRSVSVGSQEEMGLLIGATPSARLAGMSTPLGSMAGSRKGSMAETPKEWPTSRRRQTSSLSWFEDAAVPAPAPAAAAGKPAVVRQHWARLFDGSQVGEGDAGAGGPHHSHNSLMGPGLLPRACCLVPGGFLFGLILAMCVAMYCSPPLFLASTAALTIYVFSWTTELAIFSCVGAWRMRRAADRDWHEELVKIQEETPGTSDIMHIVIIPNYKEDAEMLKETLENIGASPSAKGCIRIVLGMEEREGPMAVEKAEWLIQETSHLFADVFAAFHPPGRRGELAGKSSNTQWAYRAALHRWGDVLSHCDPARVFLSVGDADTLWNTQYFDALACQGLAMPREEAAWAIWQPPMLLFRNLFAVPAFTRLSSYGTLLFELAGLARAQGWGTHFCFSSYSLTLALAAHHKVGGWDADVIAEDHHMYCKCFFASIWEALEAADAGGRAAPAAGAEAIEAKVSLHPIYLPALGYLVESSDGYFQSCKARFLQARRHSQGVAELSYVVLQYCRVLLAGGGRRLSWRAHSKIYGICQKMAMVHIINNVHAVCLLLVFVMTGFQILRWAWGVGLAELASGGPQGLLAASGLNNASGFDLAKWALVGIFGPAPPVGIMSAAAIFIVIKDVVEGRYTSGPASKRSAADQTAASLGLWKSVALAAKTQCDMFSLAEPTVMLYGMVPAIMASWSLLCKGPAFDYIVAEKPSEASSDTKR